jgi:hypothetical protein
MGKRGEREIGKRGRTGLLSPLDQTERRPVLDRPTGVHELCLSEDLASRLFRKRVDADLSKRTVSDSESKKKSKERTRGVFPIAPMNPLTGRE